jgi:hypothetical protein
LDGVNSVSTGTSTLVHDDIVIAAKSRAQYL